MKHKGTKRIETRRLVLRRFTNEDASEVFKNWASDDEVTKYLTWPTHKTIADSEWFMDFCIEGYKEANTYQWGIENKETGELIGNISVVRSNDDVDSFELGWVIGRKWWNQGYTSEAAEGVLRFLFEEVGANRIAARHDPANVNSGRVMKKIGMKYEGCLRAADRNNQGIVDCMQYSILRCEYEEQSACEE